jgi:hypothetical protein
LTGVEFRQCESFNDRLNQVWCVQAVFYRERDSANFFLSRGQCRGGSRAPAAVRGEFGRWSKPY